MRVPLSWLHEFVDPGLEPEALADVLTNGGLEVEAILRPTAGTRGVVVAEVRSVQRLEGSERLQLVEAFDGQRAQEVVCGAANYVAGDRVAWAQPGAVLPDGLEIGRKQLFGVTSNGMLASMRELALGDDHAGIWVLEPDAPVGAALDEWLDLDDVVLDVKVNPDRGYANAVLGVARDVAALTGAELRTPDEPPPTEGDPGVPVSIADPERCPRFDARSLADVTVRPSPAWLQRRLAAAGMRPRSNVVDATNYTMLELGNPIHAYDRALLAGPRIEVRTARAGETLLTLDGVERGLDPDDLLICDDDGPIALAGVMGGASTEINDGTRDVLLEVANFSAGTVLRSARRHKLFTEGSTRWEKMVPPETAPLAAARCAVLISELTGGQVTGVADHYPAPRTRPTIRLSPRRARSLLGLELGDEEQAALLEALDCAVTLADGRLDVVPPPWRPDLEQAADLCEELARLHGYEAVPERLPATGRAGRRSAEDDARNGVRRALAGGGWTEVVVQPFIAVDDLEAMGWDPEDPRRAPIALRNPLSRAESVLRTSLLPGLLRTLRYNANRGSADLRLFEVGRVFRRPTEAEPGAPGGPGGTVLPAEPQMLGLAACGQFEPARHDRPSRPADLYDLLGAFDLGRRVLGRTPFEVVPIASAPYHPGRAAQLILDGRSLGTVGELHPRLVTQLGLPERTLAGELRLDWLVAGGAAVARGFAPSALPALRFDVAVLVDDDVPAAAVERAVRGAVADRLTACELFDVYTGPSVGEHRRSLAYRIVLDDPVRQLEAADEAAAIAAIERRVEEEVGGRLRR